MNVLVTGGTGFLGHAILGRLIQDKDNTVVSIERDVNSVRKLKNTPTVSVKGDIRDYDFIRRVIVDYEIEEIYHCAAQAIVRSCALDPYTTYDINIMGTVALLEACRNSGQTVKSVVISTSVTGDTPILVRIDGKTLRINIKELWDIAKDNGDRIDDEHYKVSDISILNIENDKVVFSPIDIVTCYNTNKNIFNIEYSGGNIKITEDHSVFVFNSDGLIEEKRGDQIEEGDILVSFDRFKNENSEDSNQKLYDLLCYESTEKIHNKKYDRIKKISLNDEYVLEFLGAYLAEGCASKRSGNLSAYSIDFNFNNINEEYLHDFVFNFCKKYGYEYASAIDGKKTVITVYGQDIASLCLDLFGHGARDKRLLNDWAWSLSQDQVKKLLIGFSGDAYKEHPQGILRYTTSSRELAVDISWLLQINGIPSRISSVSKEYLDSRTKPKIDGREINTNEFWYITIPKKYNFLNNPESEVPIEPFEKCLPTNYIEQLACTNNIKINKVGYLRKRGVGKDKIIKFNPELECILKNNRLSYLVVNSVELLPQKETEVFDVSCLNPEFPSFLGGVKPILCHNSDKAYGHAPIPYTECTPLNPLYTYETSKACQQLVSMSYYHNYGVPVKVIASSNVYGPGDPNLSRIIPNTIMRLARGTFALLNDGAANHVREFVYIDDVVNAFITVARKGISGQVYCCGGTEHLKIEDLLKMVCDLMGKNTDDDIKIFQKSKYFKEIDKQCIDSTKLQLLGWKPTVSLIVGLKKSIEYYTGIANSEKVL